MRTIISATDFSKLSGSALREATKLAETIDARVLLVFVQNTTDMRYAVDQGIPLAFQNSRELQQEMTKHLAKTFAGMIQSYGGRNRRIETVILKGNPWQEISNLARKKKADFIFVGSRGLSPLKSFILGSTTQNLIRVSTCPVVVVHNSKRAARKKLSAA